LEKLSARYPLYIVSNCQDGYIEAMFAVHDLQKYFRDYECSGRTGKAKFENLKSIVERNHLQQPVYIGDTKTDQVSCCKAGIPFIYASFGFGEADDYAASVDTFSKLAQLFLTEQ
jgi:phosphoglycolate phosphatase